MSEAKVFQPENVERYVMLEESLMVAEPVRDYVCFASYGERFVAEEDYDSLLALYRSRDGMEEALRAIRDMQPIEEGNWILLAGAMRQLAKEALAALKRATPPSARERRPSERRHTMQMRSPVLGSCVGRCAERRECAL